MANRTCVFFRQFTARDLILWGLGAAASFHLAYEWCPPFIIVFLFCAYQIAHAPLRPQAMYSGWVLGLLVYGPQLAFFWTIFGFGAVGLWLVLGTWLSVFLVLQRFALLKLGPRLGALAAPFLWTGLEYFRSELYYLRFSWLNVGYVFSPSPMQALLPWLGMYGAGFLLMLFASLFPFLRMATRRERYVWSIAFFMVVAIGALFGASPTPDRASGQQLKIAGVQLEFPDETTVLTQLDKLLAQSPETQLFVLSEYTFDKAIPPSVKAWCARNRKHLIAGGKQYLDTSETQFHNTAFVIGPDGTEVFAQVKAVPIQFFKDGFAATGQNVWDSPWGRLGLCVCYDLSYTRVTDELVRKGAQAIIVPTMDMEEWGVRQHRLHARVAPVRAAEYGVPIFRLCSSGISQAVNAHGKVLATAPFPGQERRLNATIELSRNARIPLDRYLVWLCLAVCGVFLVWSVSDSFRPARREGI